MARGPNKPPPDEEDDDFSPFFLVLFLPFFPFAVLFFETILWLFTLLVTGFNFLLALYMGHNDSKVFKYLTKIL